MTLISGIQTELVADYCCMSNSVEVRFEKQETQTTGSHAWLIKLIVTQHGKATNTAVIIQMYNVGSLHILRLADL